MRIFVLIASCIIFSLSIAETFTCVENLKWVHTADPEKDAIKALEDGDKRLKAVWGRRGVNKIPGTKPEEYARLKQEFGIYLIGCTSDDLENWEHNRLVGLAIDYARQYNRIILKRYK